MEKEITAQIEALLKELKQEGLPVRYYLFLHEGKTYPAHKKLVHSINEHFHHSDSDEMQGNWLIIYVLKGKTAARINLDDVVKELEKNGPEAVKSFLCKTIETAVQGEEKISGISLDEFESIKKRLIVRLVPNKDLTERKDEMILRQYKDFALVVYIEIGSLQQEYLTTKLNRHFCESWNMTDNEIIGTALANMSRKYPLRFLNLNNLDEKPGVPLKLKSAGGRNGEHMNHVCLVNTGDVNGASAVFYPGVMKKLYGLTSGPFYAVFTSMHEVHIHKASSITASALSDMLARSNRRFPEDRLTNTVFMYDCSRDSLAPAEC